MGAPEAFADVGRRVDALRLAPGQLRRRVDPTSLTFSSTADLEPLENTIGQPRVVDAINFGLQNTSPGYNLFVTGTPGSGRMSAVRDHVEAFVRDLPPPDDWIYVYNFDDPDRPVAIRLPAGTGRRFAGDAGRFIEAVPDRIRRALESDAYDARRRALLAGIQEQTDTVVREMKEVAAARGFVLEMTPMGFVCLPVRNGKAMALEEVERLPADQRAKLEAISAEIREHVTRGMRQLHALERDAGEAMRKLDSEAALFAIEPLLDALRETYAAHAELLAHLERVRTDILEHLAELRGAESDADGPAADQARGQAARARYRVNVLVDNGVNAHPSLVVERNPTYYNLIGRVEYRAVLGVLSTDFMQIRAGALHRANGGFLVMEARDVLTNPFAWEALKRALTAREVSIENLGEQFSAVATAGLSPQPIPIDLKVVLVGDARLYHLLYALDEDFRELFKVRVDFAPEMPWTEANIVAYGRFISRYVRARALRHFDAGAVARVVERGSRLREHQGKLTTRLIEITDLVDEASFVAGSHGRAVVEAADVTEAVRNRERRSNLPEERLLEVILEGTLAVATSGTLVGAVNGLSVVDVGDYRFGLPTRVTAQVSMGRGQVHSIERETDLSGPIHSKGFLTLQGYLAGRYGQDAPMSLNATLTFEQGYELVEGDSASTAELCALLSAVAELPVRQSIAMTGAINQHGEVQAVGGVTEKIEGFFRLCAARGLTGDQGVVIPRANQAHVWLSDETVAAVEAGRFHVWAVSTLDEAIEVLTGHSAGTRKPDRTYPVDSVHDLVTRRLQAYAEKMRTFATGPGADGGAPAHPGILVAPSASPARRRRRRDGGG